MTTRALPPIWLMAAAYAPIGISGAVALLTLPQILAAQHVPEPEIAKVTGLFLSALFCAFLLSPMLDVWFRRRTYSGALNIVSAVFMMAALALSHETKLIGILLFISALAVNLSASAVGGWLGSLVPREADSKLGAAMVAYNVGSFGVTAVIGIGLYRALPAPFGALVLGALVGLPTLILPLIPAPPPDAGLARESFARFSADVLGLLKQPPIVQALLLFALPAGTFALTNTLGGLGHDYGAPESFVALVGGIGVTVAGLFGALIVPSIAARFAPRPLYLAIGVVGAIFSLCLILTPRTPAFYVVALMGQNIVQAAAFALVNIVAFRTIGKDNPLAATIFGLIFAAQGLPLTYMQVLDGHAYGLGGLPAMYATDAGLGLIACAALALMLLWVGRRKPAAAAV